MAEYSVKLSVTGTKQRASEPAHLYKKLLNPAVPSIVFVPYKKTLFFSKYVFAALWGMSDFL